MAGSGATVNHPRSEAVTRRIAALDGDPGRLDAVALGLVDGVLEGDGEMLGAALDALRDARAGADERMAGWLDAAIAFAHWGLERAPSSAAVAAGSQAHAFLRALDGSAHVASADLRDALGVDETQVSRSGRRLLERGLVTRRKAGRQVFWQLTPRGRRALADAPAPKRAPGAEFWQEALRRGYEGESGILDPVRAHVVATTLDLHKRQGIRATKRAQIARAAGVPEATVRELFPTQDDLVRGCAVHLLEELKVPPADRSADVFAGAASDRERIRRLVTTFFGAYERGADGIAAGRRERHDAPIVDETVQALDDTLDALAAEALPGADRSAVAAVRGLTDVEVWRALRERGATPEAAVEQASGAVERWLAARPARRRLG